MNIILVQEVEETIHKLHNNRCMIQNRQTQNLDKEKGIKKFGIFDLKSSISLTTNKVL